MRLRPRLALVLPLFWGTSGAVEFQDPVVQWRQRPLEVLVAVSWDLTRSDGGKQGVATHTEHYRETWFFEMRPGLDTFLVSPRGRAEVTGVGYELHEVPRRIVFKERDLALLLGVPLAPLEDEDGSVPLVALDLLEQKEAGQDFILPLSEQDYVAVHLDLSL